MNRTRLLTPAVVVMAMALAGCVGTREGASGNQDSAASSGGAKTELVFAAVPVEESQNLENSFKPLIATIEKETGAKVTFQPVASNSGVIEAQIAKRVDVAQYGAFSYYLASSKADVTPVAVPVQFPDGQPGAKGYGVKRAGDTSITNDLTSLKGKNICFTDPGSTTGYLQPLASMKEAGFDPEKDAKVVFSKGHDTAVASLLAKDCDVAFVGDLFIDALLPAKGLLKPGQVEKIYTTPLIPGPPIVVGNWLPEEQRTKIQDAITKYTAIQAAEQNLCPGAEVDAPKPWGDQAGKKACVLGTSEAWQFVKADKASYDSIQKICDVTKAEVCAKEE